MAQDGEVVFNNIQLLQQALSKINKMGNNALSLNRNMLMNFIKERINELHFLKF